MSTEMTPLVSVLLITYNHEKYIARAIEGVLDQKTNFKTKLFIGEDCSKDNTREICIAYAKKFPETIELICTETNNMRVNAYNIMTACAESGSKYIGFCEGDDYWLDPLKLQKQVDFLEANPDFSMCFSEVEIKDELGRNWEYAMYFPDLGKDVFTTEDFILSGMSIVPTPTLLCRNLFPDPVPQFFVARSGDIGIQIFMADKGKAKRFSEKMAVYRDHSGGITKSKEHMAKSDDELMELFHLLNKYFGFRYNAIFRKRFFDNARVGLTFGIRNKKGIERIRHYFKVIPNYVKYSDKLNFKEIAYYHTLIFFPFILKLFKKSQDAV